VPGRFEEVTMGQMITAELVRELLAAPTPDAALVLVDGEVRVSTDSDGDGGLVVARRDDLLSGQDAPSEDRELQELAQRLDTAVTELGG
jgi:hypothetical protein